MQDCKYVNYTYMDTGGEQHHICYVADMEEHITIDSWAIHDTTVTLGSHLKHFGLN